MPRRREYEEGLSERLFELLRNANESSYVKRIQCVYFRMKFGFSPGEISQMIGYNSNYIEQIQARFWKDGEEIFQKKQKGGRYNENMTVEEEKEFLKKFEKRAGEGKFVDTTEIHKAYEEKIGRKVYRSVIYDLLSRNGWRKIMPRPKHAKNDPVKMENFKKDRISRSSGESKGNSKNKKSTIENNVSR